MTISISAQRISGAQIKEARKLLGWTQQKLAEMTDLSLLTVKRLEAGKAGKESIEVTAQLLHSAGIEFVPNDRAGGVKLVRPEPPIANRMAAADSKREPMYPSRKRRRRTKRNPMDLGDVARRILQGEAQAFVDKIRSCYETEKIDRQSAERMTNCADRVATFAKSINKNVLLKKETLPCAQEQLFLADLIELRSSEKCLRRLLRHK